MAIQWTPFPFLYDRYESWYSDYETETKATPTPHVDQICLSIVSDASGAEFCVSRAHRGLTVNAAHRWTFSGSFFISRK